MQIETERLILREFVPEDWMELAAYWVDPRYQRFHEESEDVEVVVRRLLGRFVAAQAEVPRRMFQLAVVERGGGRLIGNCGVRVNDAERREGNIGYELNPKL